MYDLCRLKNHRRRAWIRTFVALYVKESQLSSPGRGEESAAAEAEASS